MLHSNKTFLLFSFNPGLCLAHPLGVASLVAYCQLIHNLKYTVYTMFVCQSIRNATAEIGLRLGL